MPFRIIRDDITRVSADAIVNTANPHPVIGRGTDSAIYKAAGEERLLEERRKIGDIEPGRAKATPAFDLDAKYIIHTRGPEWRGGDNNEADILASCYRQSLLLADYLGCESIAFPLLSTGNYGFPRGFGFDIAIREISDFLNLSEMDVTLVVFDRSSYELSRELTDNVSQFIDENYVEIKSLEEYSSLHSASGRFMTNADTAELRYEEETPDDMAPLVSVHDDADLETEEEFDAYFDSLYEGSIQPGSMAPQAYEGISSLEDAIRGLGATFQEKLLSLIDDKGFTDTQVYKRANIDRKLFSKIRCNPDYKPSKNTALALSISLELSLDETVDLIGRAGLAFSPSSKSDLIIKYCILNNIYDIYEVNLLLFEYDQQLLGAATA